MNTTDLVRSFYADLWNRWDDTAVDSVLADDFSFRGSLGDTTSGRDGWRRYRDLIHAGASDFLNEIEALVVDGDRAAARLLYTGTHDGPLAGMPPTGRPFTYAGAAFFTARSGQLASAWVLGDLAGLRAQLGSRS
ncbi:MAG TPA: ester cyclase [Nocardioidaceae bacterium]|nr:ester cyclase [Nocardioidaceae bacterium]